MGTFEAKKMYDLDVDNSFLRYLDDIDIVFEKMTRYLDIKMGTFEAKKMLDLDRR
jgi:hypothetical protein